MFIYGGLGTYRRRRRIKKRLFAIVIGSDVVARLELNPVNSERECIYLRPLVLRRVLAT